MKEKLFNPTEETASVDGKETPTPAENSSVDKGIETSEGENAGRERAAQHHEEDRRALGKVHDKLASIEKPGTNTALTVSLSAEEHIAAEQIASAFRREKRWSLPAVAVGNKTATVYDSRVHNFSTVTSIADLPGGKRVFVVYNYPLSGIHRTLDGLMKRFTDCRMSKAASNKWKKTFESRSNIPTIDNDDPNTVLMPFIPNVNAYDLFANRKDIGDFGECDFANDVTPEQLLGFITKIIEKVKNFHGKGVAWGELILPNMIVDRDQQVHICDPETQYDEDVPFEEQKARDLLDFITSAAATMYNTDGIQYASLVKSALDSYGDQQTIAELQKLAAKKPSLINKLFFGYSKARLGLKDAKQQQEIRQAIIDYKG